MKAALLSSSSASRPRPPPSSSSFRDLPRPQVSTITRRSSIKSMEAHDQAGGRASSPVARAAAQQQHNGPASPPSLNDADPAFLAPRSARARQPALSYYGAFVKACANLWTPENPNGAVVASVAENRIAKTMLADALAAAPRPPDAALGYNNFRGIDPLRTALAGLLQRTLLRRRGGVKAAAKEEEEERRRLVAEMFLACGAGSVVDLLFHLLASPGDGVLIPAPYYPAFDNDLAVRNGVSPVPVFLQGLEDGVDRSAAVTGGAQGAAAASPPSLSQQLDAAVSAWESEQQALGRPNSRVRALLLTNPSNPLGTVLRRQQVLEMARWAHGRGLHLVSDEIYGSQLWGEEEEEGDEEDDDQKFVSAWRLLADGDLARQQQGLDPSAAQLRCEALTHVIWALSKDACASGLRVGVLLTRNPGVLQAWGNLSYFAGTSFTVQHQLASVLSDAQWTDAFWAHNRAQLRASWQELTTALDAAGIPYVSGAKAAMFCWIDLREGLLREGGEDARRPPESGSGEDERDGGGGGAWEAERALWRDLVRAGVVVTPGGACHAPEPGFFRVCWAWMPREALPVAVARMRGVVEKRRSRRGRRGAGAVVGGG